MLTPLEMSNLQSMFLPTSFFSRLEIGQAWNSFLLELLNFETDARFTGGKSLDINCTELIDVDFQALEYSHFCKYACSEEVPELQDMGGPVEGLINLVT